MLISRYNQFVSNSNDSILSESNDLMLIENEYLKMKSEGLSESYINENIFTSLFTSLGGGLGDTFKNYIVDWAADKLGIDYKDSYGKPTFFYQVIRNIIEEIHFTKLGNYFGKNSCKNWAKAIITGLAESLEEKTLSTLLPKLGLNIDTATGFSGTIAATLRETLTNSLNNTAFMKKVEESISDKICGFNLEDVLSGNIKLQDKTKILSGIENAESKDPDIFTKAMKSGLSNVISLTSLK